MTIKELRRLRRDIRQMLNLIAGGARIRERQADWWRANMEARLVTWTPKWPFKPYPPIDAAAILFFVAHEASHIIWSGGYTRELVPEQEANRFHRFVNAIEDVRCDRRSSLVLGAFRAACVRARLILRADMAARKPEGMRLVDAVGLNAIYSFDIGEQPFGNAIALEASKRLWPRLTRIANDRSTQAVASALEPIYLELRKIEEEELERQRREEEERRRREQEERQREQEQAELEQAELDEFEPDGDAPGPGEDDAEDGDLAGDPESGPEGDAEGERGDGAAEQDAGDEAEQDAAEQEGGDDGEPGGDEDEEDAADTDTDAHDGDPDTDDADPLAGLDELPDDAGADQPAERPAKSDGDPGTEPSAFGDDIKEMAEDALDEETEAALRELAREIELQRSAARSERKLPEPKRWRDENLVHYRNQRELRRGAIGALASRLRAELRHNALENADSGQRRGRFDPGRAHRLASGNFRVFKRPGTPGGHDYTFGLLVDVSGSMYDRKFLDPETGTQKREVDAAFEATVLVLEALDRAGLGEFAIFWDSSVVHVKPLHEPLASHQGSIGGVFARSVGGCTYEAPALSVALDEFEKVRSGEKLLISITDGQLDDLEESKELLVEAAEQGIRSVAIRIDGSPAKHYDVGYSVAHANELSALLPKIINQVVRRIAA